MNTQTLLDPKRWAERTFGKVQLHDLRRTRRTVKAASNVAENPLGSLPAQMRQWKETKALYRLLGEPDVTFAALIQPHQQQTREQAKASPVTLLVQDTTDIDLSHRHHISGVGHIGNERGRGFFVQTVLAVLPQTREVLGCIAQEPFVRLPAPDGEQRHQRHKRETRETDGWMRQVHAIGTPPAGSTWVHVGDRGADLFPFFHACRATQTHVLVRAAQNRCIEQSEEEMPLSLDLARSWPSQASRPLEVPARHGHQARSTHVQISFGQMTLLPPRHDRRTIKEPVPMWVIRVREAQAPQGEDPLEWLLLTSVPTTTLQHAWERVNWYQLRWLVEEYHHCLKSGCRIEERQLQSVEGLIRLLGLLSPLAVRLLQIREGARRTPERPASEVIEPLMLAVLAQHVGRSSDTMTLGTFWTEVARLGGYLARRRDDPPGWRTIWKGWLFLQALLEGVHLAFHLRLSFVGKNQASRRGFRFRMSAANTAFSFPTSAGPINKHVPRFSGPKHCESTTQMRPVSGSRLNNCMTPFPIAPAPMRRS